MDRIGSSALDLNPDLHHVGTYERRFPCDFFKELEYILLLRKFDMNEFLPGLSSPSSRPSTYPARDHPVDL